MNIHKDMVLDKKWFLGKSYFLLFEMITPIIELIGIVSIAVSFIFKILDIDFIILYFIIVFIYGFGISATSLLLERYAFTENIDTGIFMKLIFLSLFESIGYRQLLSFYRVAAFIGYSKNKEKWGTIKRTKNN